MSAALDAALEYAERGWRCLAVHAIDEDGQCTCGKPDCPSAGKHPATHHGVKDATTDPAALRRMFAGRVRNVGIATGDGLVVLDVDPRNDGDKTLQAWIENLGAPMPETATVATGGGGWHYYFSGAASSGVLGPGLDLKSDGGYVVAPSSIHASGREYVWTIPPGEVLAPLPQWLRERSDGKRGRKSPEEWAALLVEGATTGTRNMTCTSVAGHLLGKGVDPRVAFELLCGWDAGRNRPPLGPQEIERVVVNIARAEARKLRRRAGR